MLGYLAAGAVTLISLDAAASAREAAARSNQGGYAAASAANNLARVTEKGLDNLGTKIDNIDHARDMYLALRERYARDYPSTYERQLQLALQDMQSRWKGLLRMLNHHEYAQITTWNIRDLLENTDINDVMANAKKLLEQEKTR